MMFSPRISSALLRASLVAGFTFLTTGCGRDRPETESGLPLVRFQTDWYPQAEHGGYYQAMAEGYYAEAGIEVDIMAGGPGSLGTQKVATGRADFAMGRSDDVMLAVQEGLPIVIICALMQHDPQALLLHESNPINAWGDFDGKTVMSTPGAAWALNLEKRYDISINLIPMNYGLAQFMSDPDFIQQCFITNEPFFVRQNGGNPKTMLLAQEGYDPYRVIFTSRRFAAQYPERVRAFVAASIKGWDSFLDGDASQAKEIIASRNESMSNEFMDFSIAAMKENKLVRGRPELGEANGGLQRDRLASLAVSLHELGIVREPMAVDDFVMFDFLPEAIKPLVDR